MNQEGIPNHLQSFFSDLTDSVRETLNDYLVGIYVHGSLTYGGYVKERSDIDVLVLLKSPLTAEIRKKLDNTLVHLSKIYPVEVKNIELDTILLEEIKEKREVLNNQYAFNGGHPADQGELSGFWIELANTRENGIVLYGPKLQEVIPAIDRTVLVQANKEKLVELQRNAEEWEKRDLWNQVYILVQISRVFYSFNNQLKLTSKQGALAWAVDYAPEQFTEMLKVAQEKLDNFQGPREPVISENWEEYLKYVELAIQSDQGQSSKQVLTSSSTRSS